MKSIPFSEMPEDFQKEIMQKLESGELVFSSPCDAVWTEEDKERLDKALAEMFGWK